MAIYLAKIFCLVGNLNPDMVDDGNLINEILNLYWSVSFLSCFRTTMWFISNVSDLELKMETSNGTLKHGLL